MKKQIISILFLAALFMFTACEKEKEELKPNQEQSPAVGTPEAVIPNSSLEKGGSLLKATSLVPPVLNAYAYDSDPNQAPTITYWISNQVCAPSGQVLYLRYFVRIYTIDRYTNWPNVTYNLMQDWTVINQGQAACYNSMNGFVSLPYCSELYTQGCVLAWIWNGSQWVGPVQSNFTGSSTYPSFCL